MIDLKPDQFLQDLGQLPSGLRVAIYGTGEMGGHLLEQIRRGKSDAEVVTFFDSYRGGTFQGVPVLQMPRDAHRAPAIDVVLVATVFWADEVVQVLDATGPFPFLVSLLSPHEDPSQRLKGIHRFDSELAAVEEILETGPDRELWRILVDALKSGETSRIAAWFIRNRKPPYLHRIGLGPGAVVIEGGVFDGTNTKEFAELVGPTGRVFGFDPLGEPGAKRGAIVHRGFGSHVEVLPLALWSEKGTVWFLDDGADSQIIDSSDGPGRPVEAISIDEFVAGKGLQRVDYIKLDVEGAEQRVLKGAQRTLAVHRPQLAVSIYHSLEDFWAIPTYLADKLTDYRFHLHAHAPVIGDVVLYALPR